MRPPQFLLTFLSLSIDVVSPKNPWERSSPTTQSQLRTVPAQSQFNFHLLGVHSQLGTLFGHTALSINTSVGPAMVRKVFFCKWTAPCQNRGGWNGLVAGVNYTDPASVLLLWIIKYEVLTVDD